MKERQQAEAAGKSTATVDYKMKAESGKLTKECTNMDKLVYEYENNVAKYESIPDGTKRKRIKELKPLLDQWKKSIGEFKAVQDAKTMAMAPTTVDMSQEIADLETNKKYKAERDEDGEYAHTKELSAAQLMQHNKNQFAETDKQLDKISNIVGQIHYENENFRDEVGLQNKMLDKVNKDIDQNIADMVKLDSKLKKLLAKGSICWLWIAIIIELVILIVIVTQMA